MKAILVVEWELEQDKVCDSCECESKQEKKSSFESYNMGYELGYEHGFKEAEIQNDERHESDMYSLLDVITKMKDPKFNKDTALNTIFEKVKKLVV